MAKKTEQPNAHDTFFKHFFQHPEIVADFLKHNLPFKVAQQLDFSTLREHANEFLPNKYRNTRRADVVYSVKKKGSDEVDFLIHIEHQSTPDKDMAIRLLECWPPLARKFASGKAPIILSFVLYHNSREWKSPKSISDVFIDPRQLNIPLLTRDFLIDLTKKPMQALKEQGKASAMQMILARQPSGMMMELLQDVKPDIGNLRSCCQEAAFAYMERVDNQGGKPFLDEFTKLVPDKTKKLKDMFERTVKQAEQTGMEKLAFEIVKKGIMTEQQAKQVLEETKKRY